MALRWNLQLIVLLRLQLLSASVLSCPTGYEVEHDGNCSDLDECEVDDDYPDMAGPCGENAICINTVGSFYCSCQESFTSTSRNLTFQAVSGVKCEDIDECQEAGICGPNAECHNSIPWYSCVCADGFRPSSGEETFRRGDNVTCQDVDECAEEEECGPNAYCTNTVGSYSCNCNAGFVSTHQQPQLCQDVCLVEPSICGNGSCKRDGGGHYCICQSGFSNYGSRGSRCAELDCDVMFKNLSVPQEMSVLAHELLQELRSSCEDLSTSEEPAGLDGSDMLERLLAAIHQLLSRGRLRSGREISIVLELVERVLKMIGPFVNKPRTWRSTTHADVDLLLDRNSSLPRGAARLRSEDAQVDLRLETAAGDSALYPGFATAALLTYKGLEESADAYFDLMDLDTDFKLDSKVVTVAVSNRDTSHLEEPVNITFQHLNKETNESHLCVFWDPSVAGGGAWSQHGCRLLESDREHSVCSCSHLSSFAVLMALYEVQIPFQLSVLSWLFLCVSLVCLLVCVLTFGCLRSIQSARTSIHLHLCCCLFLAFLIFLLGIDRTQNQMGCAAVAALLHYFFLAAFCWMCLEGVQLFRMVVLVFNTNFKTLYMTAAGYGVPAVIVGVSLFLNPRGYGTKTYCWLKLDSIWSFYGPVCVIILVNIFFFLITAWKLAQKFSSLNPDLDKLQKIKAFTVTAVAQLCLLGTTWIFGCFQFDQGTVVMTYLFTIFSSLQGLLIFIMHCLLVKQVRDEYQSLLSRFCAPRKKRRYSEFSSSHSSKAQASKSSHDTGESHI